MGKAFLIKVLVFIVFIGELSAQVPFNPEWDKNWKDQPVIEISSVSGQNIPLLQNSLISSASDYLENNIPVLYNNSFGVSPSNELMSSGGYHFEFRQTINEIPVYGSSIHLNIGKDDKIINLYQKIFEPSSIPANNIVLENPENFARGLISTAEHLTAENIFFPEGNKLIAAVKINYFDPVLLTRFEKIVDYSGNELLVFEKTRHLNHGDTLLPAKVFLPDPLTTAKKKYQGEYEDNNDSDNPTLSKELKEVLIRVKKNSGNAGYRLRNSACRMVDTIGPRNHTAKETDSFFFTRSQKQFEEVNAFYHISSFKDYMDGLGYENLIKYSIAVDAHGDYEDNSMFKEINKNKGFIVFGDGGVDDAEDADVIVHEYTHAVLHSLNPNFFYGGGECMAIEEGICDYFACSWSRKLDSADWEPLFNWDGNNEFWRGRSCAVDRKYDPSAGYSKYELGEIWSSALMDLWGRIGRQHTDKLMFETLFYLSPGMKLPDMAKNLLLVDSIINNKKYSSQIREAFESRNLIREKGETGIAENQEEMENTSVTLSGSTIFVALPSFKNKVTLEVLSLEGKILETENVSNIQTFSHITSLTTAGIYLVRISSMEGQETFRIFISGR